MNNERFTFLKSAGTLCMAFFMCLAFSTNVQAQTCAQNSVVSLDAETCEAVILLSDLSPGATSFYAVTLKEPGEHAGTPIDPVNGGVSVVVSTPGKYKYQVDSESGCWAYFHVEDKTGPKCIAGPDDLPNIYVSCTFEGELTDKFATVGASSFMDCSGLRDSDVLSTDEKVSVCPGDVIPGKAELDLPDGWSVCEVIIRRHTIADWDGNRSVVTANCTQYLYVLRPTVQLPAKHVVGTLSHDDDCEVTYDGALNPYFTDLGASYWGSGQVVELENNAHYCKWVASITEGEKIYTCTDKDPTNTATYKQLREIALIDWCGDAEKQFLTQLIDVVDDEAPVITPGTATEWPNPFDCSVDVRFSASSAWDCVYAEMSGYIDVVVTSAHANYSGGSFERITFDPAVGVTVPGVPAGATLTGLITAWDACGNSIDRPVSYEVIGEDEHAPVCISNDELFVSLIQVDHGDEDHAIGARVYPEDLDDSSYDNCEIESMHVRMPGGEWADYAELIITDSDDLDSDNHLCSTERWIELRITDKSGNQSTCKTLVVFSDNSVPVITAPADRTITCLQHPSFGTPDVWGFCYDEADPSDDENFEHCPNEDGIIGYYSRTWTVSKELKGGTVTRTATQKVYVTQVRDEKFTFPVDVKMECVDEAAVADLEEKTLHEILDNDGCGEWVMDIKEEVFEKQSDACFKIIRTYDFINWCDWDKVSPAIAMSRDEDADGKVSEEKMVEYATNYAVQSGRFSYTQIIKVVDTTDPTGDIDPEVGCDKKLAPEGSCHQAYVKFTVSASDLCSDVKDWSYEITADTDYEDTEVKFSQDGNVISGFGLPAGTYGITVTVSDKCGNTIWLTSSATVTEFDCEAPEVIGLANFTTLNEHCHVDVWLSDLLASASDNCDDTDYEGLTFGMEIANSGVPSATMPTAQSVRITSAGVNTVALWVADAAGNTAWTLVPVNAADNGSGTCAVLGGGADEASVVGNITNEFDEMVDGVMISATGSGFNAFNDLYNGIFNITIPMTSDVIVTPSKDFGHSNGVNTADIVVLQRHLLGLAPLTSAYQLIAADVTNDGSISTQDLLHMSRLTIGVYDEFPNVTSWRFVDKAHTFANPTSPWGFPETVDYTSLSSENQADFIGIKIGDLTGNAKPSQILGSDEPKVGAMTIAVDDVQIAAGATQEIEFTASNFNNFAGYQFTIQLAEGVTVEGVKVGDLPNHSEANFALNRVNEGVIATNWANANGVTLENGAVLFTLTVSAANNINVSEAIAVNSSVATAEAYNNDLESYDVDVQFNRTDAEFALFQNAPNPFSNETLIGFNLPQAGAASLKVMDVAGRVIKSINGTYAAGFHQISLNKSDLGATGVLYYQLDTDSHSATKKMVILE